MIHYKAIANHLNVDLQVLFNKLMVVKLMLQNKSLTTIIDLYKELYRFQEGFPSLTILIQIAVLIPVSSTTCERTFAKMKMMKTIPRNTMSNPTLLAVERDTDINFE